MANEKRLIDAEKLTDTIENTDWYHVGTNGKLWHGANSETDTPLFKADDIFKALNEAPTVDAVEVDAIQAWLYEIAMNNTGDVSRVCEALISRLDGLRVFAKERRAEDG